MKQNPELKLTQALHDEENLTFMLEEATCVVVQCP